MKLILLSALVFSFVAVAAPLQVPQGRPKAPRTVVTEFWKLETEGGRLTPEGWSKSNVFFVRSTAPPAKRKILVIDRDFSVWDPVIKGNAAEVIVGVHGICEINSDLRFSRWPPSPTGKDGAFWKLVLTDKHWEPGKDGRAPRKVPGAPEWRIDNAGSGGSANETWLTAETAIRYVIQMHDRTTNPVVRQNADRTLSILKRQVRH